MREPKYVITVEVNARRFNGNPLNTSLDQLLCWLLGDSDDRTTPLKALEVFEAVRTTVSAIPGGIFAIESGATQVALHQLRGDAAKSLKGER